MIRRVFGEVEHVAVPQDEEYLALVRDILENEQVRSMDGYFQHGRTTCLRHSINVSYLSYLFCKKHGLDARAARPRRPAARFVFVRLALLPPPEGRAPARLRAPQKGACQCQRHVQTHMEGARDYFAPHVAAYHHPARCREAYVIVAYDKYCSMMETLRKDVMELELLGTPVSLPVPAPALVRAKRG